MHHKFPIKLPKSIDMQWMWKRPLGRGRYTWNSALWVTVWVDEEHRKSSGHRKPGGQKHILLYISGGMWFGAFA